MSIPPPPPPMGGTGGLGAPPTAPAYAPAPSSKPSKSYGSGPSKVSRLPLILGIVAFVLGAALLLIGSLSGLVNLAGYLLAGFTPTLLLAWDVSAQRAGMKDPNFTAAPGQTRALRIVMFAGFVVALAHIYLFAYSVAESLTEFLGAS